MARIFSAIRRYAGLIGLGLVATVLLGAASVVPASAQGTVTSADIRDGTIERRDLHPQHVQGDIDNVWWGELAGRIPGDIDKVFSSEIVDGQVKEQDLSEDVQTKLNEGGEQGPEGPQGPQGEPGVSGYEVVGVEERFAAGQHELTASCPEGKVAIGGGYQASADGAGGGNTQVTAADFSGVTDPEGDGTWQATSYTVAFDNSAATGSGGEGNQGNMRVRVTCAAVN